MAETIGNTDIIKLSNELIYQSVNAVFILYVFAVQKM